MGVTAFEIKILEDVIEKYKCKTALELGSQNNYSINNETGLPPFMSEWYKSKVITYCAIDMAGDNGAEKLNLAFPINAIFRFDLVTDFGTSEHVIQAVDYEVVNFHNGYIHSVYPKGELKGVQEGYYNCWLNKHNILKEMGIMVNANPLTGNWPGHGYSYLGPDFYTELIKVAGYEIIDQGINCASGNCETGKNIWSVLQKTSEVFPDFETFKKLPIYAI